MSPQGIYVGLTREELEELRAIAIDRTKNGDRVALSGAAKSSAKNFSLSASDMLREVQYALSRLLGTGLPSVTYFDAACIRG